MPPGDVIVRFEHVSFDFGIKKPILSEVDFSVRRGVKYTIMGQNGAGKSTILKLIAQEHAPQDSKVVIAPGLTIATARQVMRASDGVLTVREFFQNCLPIPSMISIPRLMRCSRW